MENSDLTKRHLLTNKMNVHLDALGAAMLDRVRGHVHRTDIITKDHSSNQQGMMKFAKELSYPATFGNSMSNRPVFCLGVGARNSGLAFGRPRHQVVAKIYRVTRCGATGVGTTGPISIRVGKNVNVCILYTCT
jgi:hypothetical protein